MDTPRLVARAQAGDEPARTELMHRAGRLVYARVAQVVRSTPDVEDVVQDALLAVLAGLPRLREPAAFLAWLRRVTDNILADHIAGRRRSPSNSADLPAQDDGSAHAAVRAEERDRVHRAVAALPPRNRLAVELFYFQGLSCREVADFLGVSHDAARAVLSRSRRSIRQELTTMAQTSGEESHSIIQIVSGDSTFRDGLPGFEHDSDLERLYMALYPEAAAETAARAAGLPPDRMQAALNLLQEMRLAAPLDGRWRCLVPVVSASDRELIRVWAEPIAGVVIQRLDDIHGRLRALSELVEGESAKSTVMTIGLHYEAAGRPFLALREQLNASAPDRGRFGRFNVAFFTGRGASDDLPQWIDVLGGIGAGHWTEDTGREFYVYSHHPMRTQTPGIDRLRRAFGRAGDAGFDRHTIAEALAPSAGGELTPEARAAVAAKLNVLPDRQEDFWARLADLHAVGEHQGRLRVTIPSLPLAPWQEYLAFLDEIGRQVGERVAHAAEDLRRRALRASFAECLFSDAVLAFFTVVGHQVREGVQARQWVAFPAEADFSWGVLLVL